ncbi:shikimate dehydrogenase [Paenibacillus selenitireducens]|uniref:Shikimate dehydrogenase (NADP(+)) n=1 Tax=Paenibacillus selenitireducens TaxID=1324314 RepID=A0A1T2XFH6_9BACL|nr:shikimate dehydrogenase [Paenibacillus selenitireducens]OPA78363.1 shikimate dehydrogenase [Paenibacillus selenitireducens]
MISSEASVFGVIGDPIRHSKSPLMHNSALQALGIDGVYTALHVKPEDIGEAIRGIRALGFRGINVTIPHKLNVIPLLDELDEGAKFIGAVNTIVNDKGRLIGYNTDGIGYVRSLKEEVEPDLAGRRILVIGAGGAARGIVYALTQESPEVIWIANRTIERAEELALALQHCGNLVGIGTEQISDICGDVDIIINTTSVGMFPHMEETPISLEGFRTDIIVSDLIYNPLETTILRQARERGSRTHGGLGMFVYQGAYAFEYWTGQTAPIEVMRQAVLKSLL